jgi:hypothetical protein
LSPAVRRGVCPLGGRGYGLALLHECHVRKNLSPLALLGYPAVGVALPAHELLRLEPERELCFGRFRRI